MLNYLTKYLHTGKPITWKVRHHITWHCVKNAMEDEIRFYYILAPSFSNLKLVELFYAVSVTQK